MATSFGGITYEQPDAEQHPADAAAEAAIDINDPRLTSESLEDNTAADSYEVPPPPPDGLWRAKLKQVDVKDAQGQLVRYTVKSYPKMANGRPFFVTNVESALIDLSGKFDGVRVTEYHVKSLIDDRKGTSQVSTIATKVGATLPARTTDKERMEALLSALAGEPEAIVETYWEASCQTCQDAAKKAGQKAPRPFLVGMHRFPQVKGVADPMVKCPSCQGTSRAQVRIGRYLSVKEAKATRGL